MKPPLLERRPPGAELLGPLQIPVLASRTTRTGRAPGGARKSGWTARALTLLYGTVAYVAFLITLLYAVGFVGDLVVPKTIDSGPAGPIEVALAVNTALLSLFVLQHTVMARPAFKRRWTRVVPASIERSTFVLCTCAVFALLFTQWRPMPGIVWSVESVAASRILVALSFVGWSIAVASSFMVSHFDLFGLRQVWLRFTDRTDRPVGFRLVGLYRWVRHPLMLGFLVAFWATPTMTVGHLFFAAMVTVYIRFGTWMEERDLLAEHGETYLAYQRNVPYLVPWPRARSSSIR